MVNQKLNRRDGFERRGAALFASAGDDSLSLGLISARLAALKDALQVISSTTVADFNQFFVVFCRLTNKWGGKLGF